MALGLASPSSRGDALEFPDDLRTRYLAAARIEAEYQAGLRGEGVVFIGRLTPPANTPVAARVPFMKDGSFATAVYPRRTLIFYAHGHDPLVVVDGKEVAPSVLDAGDLAFVATPSQRLRSLSGSVRFAKLSAAGSDDISVELGITNRAYLYRDHGHRGGNLSVPVRKTTVRAGERFEFGGLSPIPYDLTVSAPGYVTARRTIDPKAVGAITLDKIALHPAPRLVFTYVSQLDLALSPDAPKPEPEQQTIVCDGNTRFVYTEQRDKLRNQFFLRLEPGERGVEASFWAAPSEFYDLGPGTLADVLRSRRWMKRLPKPSAEQVLTPGRVYFFRNQSRETNCLFAVGS